MRKLRMGMVGGGPGSFIGDVHRKAAALDGQIELVCGSFSSRHEKTLETGAELFLPENRCYSSYEEMVVQESKLPDGERMDFVAVVTPNHMHFAPCKYALENGFDVICDKPVTRTIEEANELVQVVQKSNRVFSVTHNYIATPLVLQAREMIARGDIGEIRKVHAHYLQGWLSTDIEAEGQKQAAWRTDPALSGLGGALGDIGTHAENLVEFVTGLEIYQLSADLTAFGTGRVLDDDGNVLLRFKGGARGTISFSQVAAGEENDLAIRVYGTKGSLHWRQENPNELIVRHLDAPAQVFTRNGIGLCPEAAQACRIPSGHPEGYLEAFANLYINFATAVRTRLQTGKLSEPILTDIHSSVRGVKFIYACVESSNNDSAWTTL